MDAPKQQPNRFGGDEDSSLDLHMPLRLGVLGGTFDPIHVGHLLIAEGLAEELSLSHVLLIPAGVPPHKTRQPTATATQRLHMVELAAAENPQFRASSIDLDSPGRSYTADLLARIRSNHGSAELYFIMGSDSLRDLPTWSRPEQIVQLAHIAVANRPGVDANAEAVLHHLPNLRGRLYLHTVPGIDISSTDIRGRVAGGKSIRYLTPDSVRRYILEQGLYSTASNLVDDRSPESPR